ncbi:MAG: hypothetical protein N2C12_17830, partial [Planctomycetales bacterium]
MTEGVDLIPILLSYWDDEPPVARKKRWPKWLAASRDGGASLKICIPAQHWVGPRLAWCSCKLPRGRRVGIASSRLGRNLDNKQAWFAVLRAACTGLDPAADLLVCSANTAAERYVSRAARIFGLRLMTIDMSESGELAFDRWLKSLDTNCQQHDQVRLRVSPALTLPDIETTCSELPDRDRALVALSDRLMVLSVRKTGNIYRLLQQRLQETRLPGSAWQTASIFVA